MVSMRDPGNRLSLTVILVLLGFLKDFWSHAELIRNPGKSHVIGVAPGISQESQERHEEVEISIGVNRETSWSWSIIRWTMTFPRGIDDPKGAMRYTPGQPLPWMSTIRSPPLSALGSPPTFWD